MDKKTNTVKLKVGDKLSRISFMTVKGNRLGGLEVENEYGLSWSISHNIVEGECYSAQYDEIVDVTKTELAEKLMNARDAVIVVNFNKQANADSILKTIRDIASDDSGRMTKKEVEKLLLGDERTLTGYVIATEPVLGRTIVIDLEIKLDESTEWDNRQRQIDHRTLNWMIYKNVKYVVKKK